MAVADLGTCESFVLELRRSGLIERGQLELVVSDFLKRNPRSESSILADFLVKQKIVTAFQAERIMEGKSTGLVLGPYTLLEAIGSGSMGTVYKAVSKTDGQHFAVKVLPRRSMWNVRLARRQVRAFADIKHPSVVPFVDVGTAGGLHYLAWPFVSGETLETMVHREKKLKPAQAAFIASQIASGLSVAHQAGLFHGLLKPSNVMIAKCGEAKVLDFGIGSLLAENEGESLVDTMSTANTMTSGLDCTAPESIMEPTNRTPAGDQYSLGCTLYFCLTGQYPFPDGSAVEKMMAHQTLPPRPVRELSPEVPEELAAIVDRLLEKEAISRFGQAEEIVEALSPFAAEMRQAMVSSSYMETPRPITATARKGIGANAIRQAVSQKPASPPPSKRVPKPMQAHLPANVRIKSESDEAKSAIAKTPVSSKPATDEGALQCGFGPITLMLAGCAMMCVAYYALTYFQVIK